MINKSWQLIARIISRPAITRWLVDRAMKTPYSPIVKDGLVYMERYWLFNRYESIDGQQMGSKYKWFPWSIRIHWIRLPDQDRHLHDHPWNARTIILHGAYTEQRLTGNPFFFETERFHRRPGDTARLRFGEYHRITYVPPDGVWTLFISGPYQGTWGFLVDGLKVQWRTYLGLYK
jgi:hypothetical protein